MGDGAKYFALVLPFYVMATGRSVARRMKSLAIQIHQRVQNKKRGVFHYERYNFSSRTWDKAVSHDLARVQAFVACL